MKFTVNVKPSRYTGSSKYDVISKIRGNRGCTYSSYGNGLTNVGRFGDNTIRVYNLHKVNTKVVQEKYKTGDKKGQTKKSKVIKPAHWVAYVYDFNIDMLKMLKLEVIQNNRNFTIRNRK